MSVITIDGEDFSVGLVTISRNCDVLDKVARRTISGDLYREILGVYFNYELTFGTFDDMTTYSKLYNKLTEKKEFHIIKVPTNRGYDIFKGYIAKVHDKIEYVFGDKRRVSGLTCSFVAKEPHSGALN